MINEANESSSACRLWRIHQVETSTRPQTNGGIIGCFGATVKRGHEGDYCGHYPARADFFAMSRIACTLDKVETM